MSSIFDELSDSAIETEREMPPTVLSLLTDTSPDNEAEPSPAAKQPAKKQRRLRKQPAKTMVHRRGYASASVEYSREVSDTAKTVNAHNGHIVNGNESVGVHQGTSRDGVSRVKVDCSRHQN